MFATGYLSLGRLAAAMLLLKLRRQAARPVEAPSKCGFVPVLLPMPDSHLAYVLLTRLRLAGDEHFGSCGDSKHSKQWKHLTTVVTIALSSG